MELTETVFWAVSACAALASLHCFIKLCGEFSDASSAELGDGSEMTTEKTALKKHPAYFTYDPEADAFYFAPCRRSAPPYHKRIEAKVILDIADDGTLAGIELLSQIDLKPPHGDGE